MYQRLYINKNQNTQYSGKEVKWQMSQFFWIDNFQQWQWYENGTLDCKVVVKCLRTSVLISGRVASLNNDVHWCKNRRTLVVSKWAGLLQVGKQTATSPNTAPWQVTHLLPPGSNLPAEDYILLHPDAAKYIWFPDIYIGGLTAAAEPKTWTINNFALLSLATKYTIYSQLYTYLCL